jgi:hypothetical protein
MSRCCRDIGAAVLAGLNEQGNCTSPFTSLVLVPCWFQELEDIVPCHAQKPRKSGTKDASGAPAASASSAFPPAGPNEDIPEAVWKHEVDVTRRAGSHLNVVGLVGVVVSEEGAIVGLITRLHGMSLQDVLDKVK